MHPHLSMLLIVLLCPPALGEVHNQAGGHAAAESRACELVPVGKLSDEIKLPKVYRDQTISRDGHFLIGKNEGFYWTITDLRTGQKYRDRTHMMPGARPQLGAKFFAYGKTGLLASAEGSLWLSKNDQPRNPAYEGDDPPNDLVPLARGLVDYDPQGDSVLTLNLKGNLERHHWDEKGIEKGAPQTLLSVGPILAGAVFKDRVATLNEQGELIVRDHQGKLLQEAPLHTKRGDQVKLLFSSDGEGLFVLSPEGVFLRLDLKTGETHRQNLELGPLASEFERAQLRTLEGGARVQLATEDRSLIWDLDGKSRPLLRKGPDVSEIITSGKKLTFLQPVNNSRLACLVENYHNLCLSIPDAKAQRAVLPSGPFSQGQAKRLLDEAVAQSHLAPADAKTIAEAMLASGAFSFDKHLPLLYFLVRETPDLARCVGPALLATAEQSDATLHDILGVLGEASAHEGASCPDVKDQDGKLAQRFRRVLAEQTHRLVGKEDYYWSPTNPDDWSFLTPFSQLVHLLPAGERASWVERIARSVNLSTDVELDDTLVTISPGVRRHLLEDGLADFWKVPKEGTVDAWLTATDPSDIHSAALQVVGTGNVSNPQVNLKSKNVLPSPFHITQTEVPLRSLNAQGKVEADFVHEGQRYRARAKLVKEENLTQAVEAKLVEAVLAHPKNCKFYAGSSNSVQGLLQSHLKEEPARRERIHVASSPEDFLKQCEKLRETVGEHGCYGVEMAGHTTGGCGVRDLFGYRGLEGIKTPSDDSAFEKGLACLRSLIPEDMPLIFTSCGGYGTRQSRNMFRMALGVEREVIAANGPCSANGWGARCDKGWLRVPRQPPDQKAKFEESTLKIERLAN